MRALPSLLLLSLLALPAAPLGAEPPRPGADFLTARLLAGEGKLEEALALLGGLLATAPPDAYLLLERADLLLRLGRVEEASSDVRRARELAPENADVWRVQGRVEMLRADRDEQSRGVALDAFTRLLAREPGDLEALVSIGQLELADGRPREAAAALAEAARLRPGHPGIEALLTRAIENAQDDDLAERVGRERLARDPEQLGQRLDLADRLGNGGRHLAAVELLEATPAAQRGTLDVRRRLALQLYLAGELARARTEAAGVVEEWPDFSGARVLLARIETSYGRFDVAHELLQPLLGADTPPELVSELLVRVLEGQGRLEEAAARLELEQKRLADEGRTAEALRLALDRARLWARHGRWSEVIAPARAAAASGDAGAVENGKLLAATAFSELARPDAALAVLGEPDPARPALAARRISVLLRAGREAAARGEMERLLAAAPEADLAVAAALAELGRSAEAIPLLERAAARAPEGLEADFRLAAAYERSGRLDEAVTRLRGLVARAPDFAPALNYLGYLWIDRGENLQEGLALVERAVRLDPDNGAYVDSLGWGLFRLGRTAAAVETLERAARLLPEDATVLEHLGDAFLASGERGRAIEAYRRAVQVADDEHSEAARKLVALVGES